MLFYETSAKNSVNVEEALLELAKKAVKVQDIINAEIEAQQAKPEKKKLVASRTVNIEDQTGALVQEYRQELMTRSL